ncbi:MAG: ubiquitin-conjugating enzyme E2 [Hyperionvirus sp.]|uniref:E2 ubiquitin-conjugating enzyme n=1 Tax=Hyperionvirus sp. TaxID=2487770 RepID=A0A3G5A9Q2_9VIRU|nr:MAG: ubiquitin-conjugating enzyme E2 [Hyperionvirus sp.]
MGTKNAVKQLLRDLKQLEQEPLIGANARPMDNDMLKWYAIVVGSEGTPYANVPIRFVLEFSESYPDAAPKAFFDTYVRYVGGASYEVEGRMAVCLNIFGNFGHVHTEWKNMSEGWSPSYTVSTILVAMQGLMMSEMLSTSPTDIAASINSAKNFKCSATKHDGSDMKKWFPSVLLTQEDVLAYNVEHKIVISDRKFNVLRDHYICYVKKTCLNDNIVLGYGVNIENAKVGMLSSPCEYLSLEAFGDGIRRSSTNRPFGYWLPILVESKQWGGGVSKLFFDSVVEIGKGIGYGVKGDFCETAVKVCTSIMNGLVVEIMNNKNNLSANDKFIDGYFAIYRLLVALSLEKPGVVAFVEKELERFVGSSERRTKMFVANLGELLIYLTVSRRYTWHNIKQFFLEECDARNVFWYAVGTGRNPAVYPELVDVRVIGGRAKKVFDATEISRNLVMFQVRFSEVARMLTFDVMDSNFGLAPEKLRADVRGTYGEVVKVGNWGGYMKWLSLPEVTDDIRSQQLVDAVVRSEKNGYHKVVKSKGATKKYY